MAVFIDKERDGCTSWGILSGIRRESNVLLTSWMEILVISILWRIFYPQSSFYHFSPSWMKIAKLEKWYSLTFAIHLVTSNNSFIMPFILITFVLKKMKLYNSKSLMFSLLLKRNGNVSLNYKAQMSFHYMSSVLFDAEIKN